MNAPNLMARILWQPNFSAQSKQQACQAMGVPGDLIEEHLMKAVLLKLLLKARAHDVSIEEERLFWDYYDVASNVLRWQKNLLVEDASLACDREPAVPQEHSTTVTATTTTTTSTPPTFSESLSNTSKSTSDMQTPTNNSQASLQPIPPRSLSFVPPDASTATVHHAHDHENVDGGGNSAGGTPFSRYHSLRQARSQSRQGKPEEAKGPGKSN